MVSNYISPMELQSIDVSTIGAGAWTAIGNPIEGALSFMRMTNDSDTDVIISLKDKAENIFLVAGAIYSIHFQANATPTNSVSKLRKHTVIYIKGAPGQGNVYVEGYYNE